MSSFSFQNPAAVQRVGTVLILGSSAILVVFAFLLWGIVSKRYDRIDDMSQTILRSEQLVQAAQTNQLQVSLYQNDTPQLSQSEMQSDMQDLAGQFGVRLEVIRADQVEQVGPNLRMALTLNGVVPENQLGGFLVALTSHEPMIIVNSIGLRRARSTNRNQNDRLLALQLKQSSFTAQ